MSSKRSIFLTAAAASALAATAVVLTGIASGATTAAPSWCGPK
jgi:hypothetical protein